MIDPTDQRNEPNIINLENTCSCFIPESYCYAHRCIVPWPECPVVKNIEEAREQKNWFNSYPLADHNKYLPPLSQSVRTLLDADLLQNPEPKILYRKPLLVPGGVPGVSKNAALPNGLKFKILYRKSLLLPGGVPQLTGRDCYSKNAAFSKVLQPSYIFFLLCSWAAFYCLLSRLSLLPKSITLTPSLPRGVMGICLGCIAEIKGPETRGVLRNYQKEYLKQRSILARVKSCAVHVASIPLILAGKIRALSSST